MRDCRAARGLPNDADEDNPLRALHLLQTQGPSKLTFQVVDEGGEVIGPLMNGWHLVRTPHGVLAGLGWQQISKVDASG